MGLMRREPQNENRSSSRPSEYVLYLYVYHSDMLIDIQTIGLVSSTPVPFTSVALGQKTFQITTSVGRCLQTYDLKRGLGLIFLTRPQTPADITATLASKDVVFAAFGGVDLAPGFWVFKRGKKVAELDVPTDLEEPIKQILTFGTWIIGCCTTRIEVWKSSTYEHYTTLYPTAAPKGGNELTGGITNMPTYLNKIFAGRKDGGVEIWNVSSGKLIFTVMPPAANCGSVTVLQPTPALSLLAIAYSEGPLIIHDIRTDKTVIQLDGGNSPITSISFRTDDLGAGEDGRNGHGHQLREHGHRGRRRAAGRGRRQGHARARRLGRRDRGCAAAQQVSCRAPTRRRTRVPRTAPTTGVRRNMPRTAPMIGMQCEWQAGPVSSAPMGA